MRVAKGFLSACCWIEEAGQGVCVCHTPNQLPVWHTAGPGDVLGPWSAADL